MADYPYDDEEQKDPLLIQGHPHPTGDVVDQGNLQTAPATAPTPTTDVDAYAQGAPPAAPQETQAAPEAAPSQVPPGKPPAANPQTDVNSAALDPDAYNPRQIPEPTLYHQPMADPRAEAELQSSEQVRAQKLQQSQQSDENRRAKEVVSGLKSSGVEMVTDLDGTTHPKLDDQGRVIYKPAVLSPFEDRGEEAGDGRYVSVVRDRFGNEQDVPLKSKIDPQTGERYVTGADGVSKVSLGVDQDYVLRRDVTNLGKVASEARAEVSALGSQKKDLTDQITDYGNQAAVIASKKTLTDDDRAEIKRLQGARQQAVQQLDTVNDAHDAKSQEAQAATQQWLDKRKLITDKIKQSMGLPGSQPPPGAPATQGPATQPDGTPTQSPLPSQAPLPKETPQSPAANPNTTAASPAVQNLPDDQKQAVADFQTAAMGIHPGIWARTKNALGSLVGEAAVGGAKSLEGFATISENIYNGLFGTDEKATGARALANALMKVPGVLTNPQLKDTPEAKVARTVGNYGSLIAEGLLDPAIPVTQMFGAGYEGQHDAAMQYFDNKAAQNPDAPRDRAAEAASADRAGLLGASINAVVALLPVSAAAKSITKVFGKASTDQVANVLNEAYEKGGAPAVANVLNELRGVMTNVTGAGDEAFRQTASNALKGVVSEITKSPTERLAAVAARSATDATVFGASQVAQNLVSKRYNPDTGLFENVPEAATTGFVMGAGFGGLEQVAAAKKAGQARTDIATQFAKQAKGGPAPSAPSGAAEPAMDQQALTEIKGAMDSHREDLTRERSIIQSEVDDASQPIEGKADKIARVKDLDGQIAAITTTPTTGDKNESATIPPAAVSPNEPQPAQPGTGGAADNRPVPDNPEAQAPVQQQAQEGAQPQPRQRDVAATGDEAPDAAHGQPDEAGSGSALLDSAAKANGVKFDGTEGEFHYFTDVANKGKETSFVVPLDATPEVFRDKLSAVRDRMGGGPPVEAVRQPFPHFNPGLDKALSESINKEGGAVVVAGGQKLPVAKGIGNWGTRIGDDVHLADGSVISHEHVSAVETPSGKTLWSRTVDAAAHEAATSPHNDLKHPSGAQAEAENYKMGHDSIGGMPISFENPAGSIRTNVDGSLLEKLSGESGNHADRKNAHFAKAALAAREAGDAEGLKNAAQQISGVQVTKGGRPWATKMLAHYGRFKGTVGADGDHLDAYVKEGTPKDYSGPVFVINQKKLGSVTPTGREPSGQTGGDFDEHKAMVGYSSQAEAVAAYAKHYDIPAAKLIHSVAAMPWDKFKDWAKNGDLKKPAQSSIGQDQAVGGTKPEPQDLDRAQRLVAKALIGEKAKASIDGLGATIVRNTSGVAGDLGLMRAKWDLDAQGNPQWRVMIDEPGLAVKFKDIDDATAQETINTAVDEEITHLATFEAVRRDWEAAGKQKPFGEFFNDAMKDIYNAMDDEERKTVQDAYQTRDLSPVAMGAEFIRQLLQQKRIGKVTEATIRARSLIEKLLAVLKSVWENIKNRSEALRRTIEQTEAVLDEIEKAGKEERGPPAKRTKEFQTAKGSKYEVHEDGTTTRVKASRPEHPGDEGQKQRSEKTVYVSSEDVQKLAPPQAHWRIIDHGNGKMSLATEKNGQWGIAESQKEVAVSDTPTKGAFPLELWGKKMTAGAESYGKAHFGNEITNVGASKKPVTPQVAPLSGMTPLGAKQEPETKPIESGASDELKAQAKKAFEGMFAPEPQFTGKEIAITMRLQRGESVDQVAKAYAMPAKVVAKVYDRVIGAAPLQPQEHGINLGAPEPIQQIALPKEKRPAFMDLADKLEAGGITTPEKLAAFINEISDGRALQYTKAVWKLMESTGAVDEKDAPANWDTPISLATNGSGPNVPGSEPPVGQRGSNAGQPNGPEDRNAGEVEAGSEVSPGAVPTEAQRPGARQPAGSGRGQPEGAGVGTSGESVAATEADDAERVDSPVAGAGSGDSGGTSLTGPTERVAAGSGSERNFRIRSGAIAPGGAVAKLKANLAALKLLKQLQKDNRPATPEEQAKLVQYTGWGAMKTAFDEIKAGRRGTYSEDANWTAKWGKVYDQLKTLLTPDEWEKNAEASMTAHYTAPEEINAMWSMVKRLGFGGGRVLEPAIGTGNFFGLMPQDLMQHSKLFGMDMDPIAGGISQKLYPGADIKLSKFEKAKLPNNYFDLVISNVPFHEVGPIDSRYPQLNLHNYFFARSFDLAKPGGLVVAITSNSTLDNNPDQRKYLADKADLVAAIRLPNNAFLDNAGTEVTTDILVFRKPDGTPFKGETFLSTVQVGEDKGQPVVANEYFARHPEMAIGKHSLQGTQYRENSYALVPDKYRPLAESLQEAIQKLPENIFSHARDFYENQQQDFGIVREGEKEGSVSFKDGRPLQVTGNEYKQPAWATKGFSSRTRDPVKRIEMAKSFVGLRDQMKELLAEELNPAATDAGLEATRAKLRDLYDKHVKAFGQLEKGNLKFLEEDPEYYLVMGLEVVGKERKGDTFEKVIKPADILSQRTLFPVTPPSHVADVKDAALVSMQYRGKIDAPYIAELTGLQPDEAEQGVLDAGLAFKNPVTGLLETRDAYLSSNVRQKLREAEAAAKDDPRYDKNVEQLKAIQPERIDFANISARAGSSWIPEPVYTSFAQKILGKTAKVTYNKTLDRWSVALGGKEISAAENKSIYGTDRATGTDILGDVLNLRNPKIYDTVEEMNDAGKMSKKQVLNKSATDQAQAKALRFKQEFDTFMREDPDANKSIEDTYNEQFNSYVVPMFDGSHLVFPGMAAVYKGRPMKLRSNQKDGVFRVTQTGGALLAHGVGAGKTITIIAAAMEMRRLGLARKPLIVVDKPTTGQFAQTFRQVYPNANVLVATEDSFTAANRKRFMSRIATGNWDAVVMSNSQFDLMPNDPAVIQQYVQTAIDQLKEIASEVESEEGKGTPKVRQIRTEIKRLENRLGKLLDRLGKRQDDTIYFEQSGVDALFVDEVHGYKKVPFVTKMDPVKGIDRQPSQKAIALHAKVQFIHENNRNKNVITATGTPVTNTLAEAWNMTRLVNPKLLEEWGVDTFDKFVSTFAEVVNSTEINAANQWVSVERLSRFTNGPELVKMIRTAWDVRMGEDLKDLSLPSIKGGKPELVSLEVTPEQLKITDFLQSVYKQFQGLEAKQRRAYSWIPIVTMSTGMAASVDPRLVNPSLPDNPNSVINKAVENVAAIYHETTPKRSTQIVFLDRYRPMNTEKIRRFAAGAEVHVGDEQSADEALKDQSRRQALEPSDDAFSESPLNLYDDLREKLVKAGVPREEIAIANEHDTDAKRLKMQEDMQTGRIRLLIGSTAKIGQGINVSDKLYAAHHLDPPIQMTPAQYIQRNGRIIRDPNENAEVRMLNYGMKRTLAAGIWDRINTKAKFIIQILMGKGVGRDFEDPADEITMSIAEQVAELTGDRRVLKKVELESQVRSLQAAREAHFNNVGSARRSLRETQTQLDRYDEDLIPAAITDKELLENAFGPDGKNFAAKVGEKAFSDPKEYDAAINNLLETGLSKSGDYFNGDGKKDTGIRYEAEQQLNGLRVHTQFKYWNPEKFLQSDPEVYTSFSTPNTKGLNSTNAKTGVGMIQAARKIWEERDQRIEQLKAASQNARDQIPKLEAEAAKTFTQEKELTDKSAELSQLTSELLGGDAPQEASGGSLTDEAPEGEQPAIGAPEPTPPAADPTQGVLKSAFAELPKKEQQVLAMRLAEKTDAEISKATGLPPVGIETAYQIAVRKMQKARQAAGDVRATMRRVMAENSGQRTLGRPDLANPAAGDLSRKLVDATDQIRKESGVPGKRKDKEVIAAAKARLQKNYDGEREQLIAKATGGQQLDDEETVMAKKIVAREALKAVRAGNDEAILEGAKLIDAYRMTGTTQARAMRQRFDNYLSPEERASEYIAESLLTPDQGRRDRLSRLGEQITDLEQQLEEAKNRNADPMDLKKLLDDREKKLAEREAIIKNWAKKVEGIKKKLAALGLDLENMSEEEISKVLKDRAKANKAIRAIAEAKADNWDALYEYWINGLLSSPTTLAVKMMSDVAHGALDFGPQRWIEAAVNQMLPGEKSKSPQFGELPYVYKSIFPALGRAFTTLIQSWRAESPMFEGEFTNSEFHRTPAIAGAKGKLFRVPTRNIMAADDAASSALATMQVQAEAYRQATAEGKKGDDLAKRMVELTKLNSGDPSDAWVAAREYSAMLRFQAELGPIGKWLQAGKQSVPGVRYALPFIKTMSNIFKIGLRKTPLGSARLLWKLGRDGAARMNWDGSDYEYSRPEAVKNISEQILAWALTFGLLGLTRKNDDNDGLPIITGTVPYTPSSKGVRDLAMRTAPPTSIRIGNKWYNYSRIEPWGVMLATTVDLINQARQVENTGDVTGAMGKLLNHTLTQVKDKTFARGVSDILNAIQDGEHAVEWAGNFAASWVPFTSLVKAAARGTDDSVRETKVWGRDGWTDSMLESLKYKAFPAASDVIQPKIDLWGNEIKKDTGISPATDWLYRMTVPVQTEAAGKVDQVDRMILNWNNAHPSEEFSPVPPPPMWEKKIDGKNQSIYMSRDEYRRFLEVSGKEAHALVEIQSLNHDNPNREDMEAVTKALSTARHNVKESLWQEHLGHLGQ